MIMDSDSNVERAMKVRTEIEHTQNCHQVMHKEKKASTTQTSLL